ncbi:MAG: FAD-dependent oxidoreductase [archaeon]
MTAQGKAKQRLSGKGKTIIIGGGITGLAIAYYLKSKKCEIFEKESELGGLCRSKKAGGYIMDYAVHTLITKEPYIRRLHGIFLRGNIVRQKANPKIFFAGKYVNYPFQASLYALPLQVQKECFEGIVAAQKIKQKPKNFHDWTIKTFGKGIAEHFLIPYNEKKYGCPAKELGIGFISWRSPALSVEEARKNLNQPLSRELGYNISMAYPKKGGFEELVKAFAKRVKSPVHLGMELESIDQNTKTVFFKNGANKKFDRLVSTIPLPELIEKIKNCPVELKNLAKKLSNKTIWVHSFGLDSQPLQDFYWAYYADKDVSFTRLTNVSAFSKTVAPKRKILIQAECSSDESKEKIIDDLVKANFIKSKKNICFHDKIELKYAYVLLKTGDEKIVTALKKFLLPHGIHSLGRFGNWEYTNSDECIMEAKKFVEGKIY